MEKNTNVKEVYIFGSLAKDEAAPGSDGDLMLILKKSEKRIIDRVTDYVDFSPGLEIGVDIFPYTEAEIKKFLQEENSFIKDILAHRIKLA